MRAREFISKLYEADATEQAASYYTIGDSHAVAVAQTGGKNWKNLAIGGKPSTDSSMLAKIDQVPKGAIVLVAQGANDTANSSRAHIDSQGKTPLVPPEKIASNVANVVSKVQARGAKVVFMLFPNGNARAPGLAKYYSGDYQEEVRQAIKAKLGGVPIIDINGRQLSDGVHAVMPVYRDVANQVATKYKPTVAPTDTNKDGKTDEKDASTEGLKVGPPYPPEQSDAVRTIQKQLIELGYQVGPMGADGKYGPYTAAAVKAFKTDYKEEGDGSELSPTAIAKVGDVTSGKIAKVEKPTAVAGLEVGTGNGAKGDGATQNAKTAYEFFIKKGWSPAQASGLVGNLQAESGANLNTSAVGDAGQAYGIAQWHPDRQAQFYKQMGKPIRGSDLKDQLEFLDWELRNSQNAAPFYSGDRLKQAKSPEEAAYIIDKYFERSTGAHRQRRMDNAVALATTFAPKAPGATDTATA